MNRLCQNVGYEKVLVGFPLSGLSLGLNTAVLMKLMPTPRPPIAGWEGA